MEPTEKVQQILTWLDLPKRKKPDLITAYFPDVDMAGHTYGPNSPEVNSAIQKIDSAIADLLDGINTRGLRDIVDLIILSDHGMSETTRNNTVFWNNIFDSTGYRVIDHRPLLSIYPEENKDITTIYNKLKAASDSTGRFDVYLKDQIPDKYHYKNNQRISPIVALAKPVHTSTHVN
jgi:predicted AlkP superfamily pyrophosphatase or phosphodiesterase